MIGQLDKKNHKQKTPFPSKNLSQLNTTFILQAHVTIERSFVVKPVGMQRDVWGIVSVHAPITVD